MKPYTLSIDIARPRQEVIDLFNNAENLFRWQPGLQSFEHIRGEPGKAGAKSRLSYLHGKCHIELTETITDADFPNAVSGLYEWPGGMNTLANRFIAVDENTTRWESTCAYRFRSLPMKVMGFLMPGTFRKQNLGFMKNFKAFCETGHDVRVSGPVA